MRSATVALLAMAFLGLGATSVDAQGKGAAKGDANKNEPRNKKDAGDKKDDEKPQPSSGNAQPGNSVTAPQPWTAEQTKAFVKVGMKWKYDVKYNTKISGYSKTEVSTTTGTGYATATVEGSEGGREGSPEFSTRTWEKPAGDMRQFPASKTKTSDVKLKTAAGTFDCVLYESSEATDVAGKPQQVSSKYWYIKDKPGVVGKLETKGNGLDIFMEIVEFSTGNGTSAFGPVGQPWSEEELKGFLKVGMTWKVKRVVTQGKSLKTTHIKYEITEVREAFGFTRRETPVDEKGGDGTPRSVTLAWKSAGGEFPGFTGRNTKITEEKLKTAAGRFDCKVYDHVPAEARAAGKRKSKMWFVKDKPGVIAKSESDTEDGTMVNELVEFNEGK